MLVTLSSFKSIFGNTITGDTSGRQVKFDGILSSSEAHTQTVTHRPVEEGYEAFDAVHQNPPIVNLSVIVADTPQSALDFGKVSALANVLGVNIVNSNASKQINELELIYSYKETITVTTKYRKYEGYYIESRSFDETEMEGVVINLQLIKRRENKKDEAIGNYSNALGAFS